MKLLFVVRAKTMRKYNFVPCFMIDRQNNCISRIIVAIVSSIANGKFLLWQNEYNFALWTKELKKTENLRWCVSLCHPHFHYKNYYSPDRCIADIYIFV